MIQIVSTSVWWQARQVKVETVPPQNIALFILSDDSY